MAIIQWEPLREIEDMFDRYTRAMGWPSGRGQELITTSDVRGEIGQEGFG